jgi:hypothetical protein
MRMSDDIDGYYKEVLFANGLLRAENEKLVAALRAPALPSEEEIARVLYDLDPYEECGEYIDGHQISPGGALTWRQACMRDAEFADEPLMFPITKSAREAARAVLALFGKTGE